MTLSAVPVRRAASIALLCLLPVRGAEAEPLAAPYQIDGMAVDLRDRGADPAADPSFVWLVDLDPLEMPQQEDVDRWADATVLTEAGPVRAGLMDIRKSCQFLCGVEEEETCHYQAALVLDQRADTGGNLLAAWPGAVEIADFTLLDPTPLSSEPIAWSRELRAPLWPADEGLRYRVEAFEPATARLSLAAEAAGNEDRLAAQDCRGGSAAGLTQIACEGIALIAADGVPLLVSWPDYNLGSASLVASFTHGGELHVVVRLGLKAQTIYGLLVHREGKWMPLFRKAERALLC